MPDTARRGDAAALLERLISIPSDTATPREADMAKAVVDYIAGIPYFAAGGGFGIEALPGDELGRGIAWAYLAGGAAARPGGRRAVILLNHHDAVDCLDYGRLRPLACRPAELRSRMLKLAASGELELGADALADLRSGDWLFGRGSCDMKSGTAVQLVALERAAAGAERLGLDLVYLSVPDEETVSWGMRRAVALLAELKERHGLDYLLAIDSEAHARRDPGTPVFYDGSIGKTMLSVYVKGVKSHIGDIDKGLNPSLILANIVRLSEIDREMSETEEGVRSPPPAWSYVRDFKECYDASIPEAAGGYVSFLPMTRGPAEILGYMKAICETGMREAISRFEDSFRDYDRGRPSTLPGIPRVMLVEELVGEARRQGGGELDLGPVHRDCAEALRLGTASMPECNFTIIKSLLDRLPYGGPIAVVALSPPYYPNISNRHMGGLPPEKAALAARLRDIVRRAGRKAYGAEPEPEPYFMGISDLSYVARLDAASISCVERNMPLLGAGIYELPLEGMAGIAAPILDIGAWGKDPHKFTERVYIPDVAKAVPDFYEELIRLLDAEGPAVSTTALAT